MGIVFAIEEFSVYDGPGIRTTVFLKGCPLRCSWCHNPEGQLFSPQIIRKQSGCLQCGRCNVAAIKNGETIRWTPRAIDVCPQGLFRWSGIEIDVETLCARLEKNGTLLANGGITFSGGEPLLQHDFLELCLKRLSKHIHTAVQTCGYASEPIFSKILSAADYFLFDIKLLNEQAHIRYTGVSNTAILRNFSALAESGKPFVVRVPLIPGVTDTEENIEQIARFLHDRNVHAVELMPYNPMAGSKYVAVGRQYCPAFDPSVPWKAHTDIFEHADIHVTIL